jgi:ABC-type amino acid transport substrate-binding protein
MSVLSAKVVSPTTVVYIFAFVLLSIFYCRKQLHFKRLRAAYYVIFPSALLPAFMLASFTFNTQLAASSKAANEVIANMVVSDKVPAHVLNHVPKAYQSGELSLTNIDVIKKRNLLRIGYVVDNVPFSYFNQNNELVGFDISLAHKLANDLDVEVEFIPFKKHQLSEYLNKGYFDIAMSGLEINVADLTKVRFSHKVLELQLAILAKDYELARFKSIEQIRSLGDLNFAHMEYGPLLKQVSQRTSSIQFKQLSTLQEYFKSSEQFDGLVISAEAGFAWSMFYPEYGVVVPEGGMQKYPIGFAVAKRNLDLLSYVDAWLSIQQTNGSIDNAYNYWILGQGTQSKETRWSVLDDVIESDKKE